MALALTGAGRLTASAPQFNGLSGCAGLFVDPAQIDVSRREIRIQPDRLAERCRGGGLVLHLAGQRGAIEMRDIELRMIGIVLDPDLIQLARG